MLSAAGQGLCLLRAAPEHTSEVPPSVFPEALWSLLGQASESSSSFLPQDYQLDTSALLSSPLLKRFTWTETKPKASMKIE